MTYYIDYIKWDRIWVYFHFQTKKDNRPVYLVSLDGRYKIPLIEDHPNTYKLNITNPGNAAMLPTCVYQLRAYDGTHVACVAWMNPQECNREFIYFHSERSYKVQFTNRNGFKMLTTDGVRKNLNTITRILSLIRRTKNNAAKTVLRFIYRFEHLLHHRKTPLNRQNPNILLMSDMSEEMGSNMAAFKNALDRRGFKYDTSLRSVTTKHYSLREWIRTLRKIARADFIFLDDHSQTTDWLKIKGTIITQLWHSGAGFKSTGYSRFGMPASPAPQSGHRQYTYGIAGSRKIRHFFSEVWGINDEQVLPTGMPRLDEFLNEEYRKNTTKNILKDYPILNKYRGKKQFILFAPTYRGENKRHAYYPIEKLDMGKIYKMCKETNSLFIFKMHPYVAPVQIPEEYSDKILDLTNYKNINDLFYITDLLITDYSSNIYEFSLMKKPMLFYAYDIDEYSKERGFHRNYRENVPGKIVETFDEMIKAIYNKDFDFKRVEEYINNNFENVDTHACDRIIDWIILNKKRDYEENSSH